MFVMPSASLWLLTAAGWSFVASYGVLGFALLLKSLARTTSKYVPLLLSIIIYTGVMITVNLLGHRDADPYWPEIGVHFVPILLAPLLAFVSRTMARLV